MKKRSCAISLIVLVFLFMIVGFFVILGFALFGMKDREVNPIWGEKIAVVDVDDVIFEVEPVVKLLKRYRDDPEIKGLVVKINSPGGGIEPTQEIYTELVKFRSSGRPVIAVCTNVAASGGYYVACGADTILAQPGTMTGSIGVYIPLMNWEKLMEKIGVRFYVVKSGKMKDFGTPDRELTDDEKEMLEGVVKDIHDQFIETVIDNRYKTIRKILMKEQGIPEISDIVESATESVTEATSDIVSGTDEVSDSTFELSPEAEWEPTEAEKKMNKKFWDELDLSSQVEERVRELADGRIFTGRQALKQGLIDDYGDIDKGIEIAARRAGIYGKPKIVRHVKKEPGILGLMESKVKEIKLESDLPVLYMMPF